MSRTAPLPPALDGNGPLWLQIRRALASAIVAGVWPAGARVPTEAALTACYVASRMTVNKALASLAAEGLVERRTRIGTIVTSRASERPVLEIWDVADTVRRMGARYGYRLLSRSTIDAVADSAMDGASPLLRLTCLHLADDRPFQFEDRLVNIAAAPDIDAQGFDDIGPGQWLLAHIPWTEARHAISARAAPPDIAERLAVAPGTACLVVERRTWNGATPVTFGRFWYPGDEHSLEGSFRPSW